MRFGGYKMKQSGYASSVNFMLECGKENNIPTTPFEEEGGKWGGRERENVMLSNSRTISPQLLNMFLKSTFLHP